MNKQAKATKLKRLNAFFKKHERSQSRAVLPDKQNFINTAIIKEKNRDFTHQEIFRLRKFITRTRQDLLCEDEKSV